MDFFGRILDFITKYSWAAFIVAGFVLFIPNDAAQQIGLTDIRNTYKGYWWIALVLAGSLWSTAVFKYFDKIIRAWIEAKRKGREVLENKRAKKEALETRLSSLGPDEKMWIKYCLYHNTQTLSAQRADTVAQSLTFKGILIEGSGHLLDLPFHIPDDVWRYLKENEEIFLSKQERRNPSFADELAKFRDARYAF